VPQWTVATIARVLYNEPYRSARMTMEVKDWSESLSATYTVEWGGRSHLLQAFGAKPPVRPAADSLEHWFKEHSWGFGVSRGGKLIRYEVSHPEWDVWPLQGSAVGVDWATLYGPEWAAMNDVQPASVVFAVGSEVAVYPKG
jgi:hypothetical protein